MTVRNWKWRPIGIGNNVSDGPDGRMPIGRTDGRGAVNVLVGVVVEGPKLKPVSTGQ
jgi:hypothetical protein